MTSAILLFVLGLILLIKGGDWFVDAASGIAKRFNMPAILIGATVVSIGTTLPEVMVSASSAISGHGEIAYGNAIGSIICNTALISAITIAVVPAVIERKSLILPVAFFFMSAVFYSTVAYVKGEFSRLTGILLLIIFVVYMFATVKQAFNGETSDNAVQDDEEENESEKSGFKNSLMGEIIFLVIGAALIAIGADLLVDNGTIIAAALGVPESVIALTFVALGTSLPELVTAVTSLIKGCGALSLGNVIGANLFNLVLVNGTSCALSPFKVPTSKMISGINASFIIDIPVMLFVMAFLTIPALVKGKLYRAQGIVLLIIYFVFCGIQFVM